MQCTPETTKFGNITQNKIHFAVQGHRFWYQSKAHTASYIKTMASRYCALSLEFMNLLGIYTVVVARSLCRRLLLNSNRKLSIVLALSTTFTQCATENYQIR